MSRPLHGPLVLLLALALWGVSFAVPAITFPPPLTPGPVLGTHNGLQAASDSLLIFALVSSEILGRHPIHMLAWLAFFSRGGALWFANILMLLAPLVYLIVRQRRYATPFLVLLWLWTLLPLAFPVHLLLSHNPNDVKLRYGFYLWWSSLLLMAIFLTAVYGERNRASQAKPATLPSHNSGLANQV